MVRLKMGLAKANGNSNRESVVHPTHRDETAMDGAPMFYQQVKGRESFVF
jgi:hypothetical protein